MLTQKKVEFGKTYGKSNLIFIYIYIYIYIYKIWQPFKYVLDKRKKIVLKTHILSKHFAFFTEALSV